MTRQAVAPWAGPVAVCLLAGTLIAGCGHDSTAGGRPSSGGTSSVATATSSPSSPPSPVEPTTPAPPPGKTVAIGKASLVVPSGWVVDRNDAGFRSFGNDVEGITCDLGQTPGMPEKRATKKLLDRLATDVPPEEKPVVRDPDLVVHRVRFYHIHSKQQNVTYSDDFGTVSDGYLISMICRSEIGLVNRPRALREINSFMSTFRLR